MSNLVNYSSSASSEEESTPACKKIKLPNPFEQSKYKYEQAIDDPTKHKGRKRQIPHITGNWSSHLYIECDYLKNLLSEYLKSVEEFNNEIHVIDSPHISLSKNFIIKYHWIDNLYKVLLQNLKFSQFTVDFSVSNIEFLSNEDKSRYFACILVKDSCNKELEKLIESTNASLKEFDLPEYYENKIFHSSIFWKLTEFSEDDKKFIKDEICKHLQNKNPLVSIVEKITLKTGKKIKFFYCQ